MELYLYLAAALIVPFGAERLILHLTRRRFKPLRFLLLLWPVFLCGEAWRAYHTGSLFIGLSSLAALFDLLLAGLGLAGWGLAWARVKRRRGGSV